ncbi:glycosyltransferase family 4 protein [Dechloromonas sp. ZS-1]|uniref:glycosyltransferase family 4 protein n=1 Tax=Dechloromonas sp. ZS-1 TaxID=3138067 RepID=UPI0031FBB025
MANIVLQILIVHSSADLYGSDRSLLDFVRYCGDNIRITVALPEHGILVDELEKAGASVIVGEVCKIHRGMFSMTGLLNTFRLAWRAVHFLSSARPDGGFDLVYSNTVAVLGGALVARIWGVPHVWHVREILLGSRILTFFFRNIVAKLSKKIVCNSQQTLEWIKLKSAEDKYQVVWNGFSVPQVEINRQTAREELGVYNDDVIFVLVGRINAWKGHKLLVEAFDQLLDKEGGRAHLVIVGSAPDGKEYYERELKTVINQSACAERIKLIPYRKDINSVWVAADVVVVPSTEPEPFGRVAIEAMGFAKPVIAAGHGGLLDIVLDGETGRLVMPRDASALSAAMQEMLLDQDFRLRMGRAGQERQRTLFSVEGYAARLAQLIHLAATKYSPAHTLYPPTKQGAGNTVLFVHQSAEMYGSDKVLLSLVLGMRERGFRPIVVLPEEGALFDALKVNNGIETHIIPVVKLNREMLTAGGILKLPFSLFCSVRAINKVVGKRNIDLVYSNTLAVLGGAVWAKLNRKPHLWHVHELLMSPWLVQKGFPCLLRLLADKVVCNSTMTGRWLLNNQPALAERMLVIWNGQGVRPPVNKSGAEILRKSLDVGADELLITLVGRINHWKGQRLLIDAAEILWARGIRNVHYLLVGGAVPGHESLVEMLKLQIFNSHAKEYIHLMPFTEDVWNVWDASDIAVVPSTEPEPFGLVAIEAMSSIKPVVVAGHGGLLDIVEDKISGLVFKPGDVVNLADAIEILINSPKLRSCLGGNGFERQRKLFSLDEQLDRTENLIKAMTERNIYEY